MTMVMMMIIVERPRTCNLASSQFTLHQTLRERCQALGYLHVRLKGGRVYWCPLSVLFRIITSNNILGFAVHLSLIWLSNRPIL